MAVPATAVFEINSAATAANVNGAGFDTAAGSKPTDLATTSGTSATPTVTSASYTFQAGDVGKWLYIQSSANNWTPGWYLITGVVAGAQLNAAIGAAIQMDTTKGYPSPKFVTNTVAGIATVSTPGGNATWAIDYSQHTAAIATASDLASDGSGVVTSATRNFLPADVGNCIHITGTGSGFTVGWYFITSVAANAATLDRSPGASKTAGVWYEGGAASLNSSTSNQTDANFLAVPLAGNFIFATGALTIAASTTLNAGSITAMLRFVGYTTNRATTPTGSSRPSITCGGGTFNVGNDNMILNLILTGTNSQVVAGGTSGTFFSNLKVTNTSTSATRDALKPTTGCFVTDCELISYRGRALNDTGSIVQYCYCHDSDVGITVTNSANVTGCLVESCVTAAISGSVANGALGIIRGNTLYGAENKLGTGISLTVSDRSTTALINNIIYGFATGVTQGTAGRQITVYSDFNDYFNNTTDNTNWFKGANDQAVDPLFVSVSQITGTAGKFAAGNDRLIDTSKNFSTLGVVAGRDCIYVISGTGATAGIYGVSSIATTTNPNDTLVLDLAPGTSTTADKVYQLTVGHNFAPKKFLAGFPGAFQASLSTGFSQIGAVQPPRMMQKGPS